MTLPAACPAPFNLARYVLDAGRATPEKTALAVLGPRRAECWSYDSLRRRVFGMATALQSRGIQPDDRVLLRIGNEPAFPVAFLGCALIGAIPVPSSAQLTEHEITKLAADLNPHAVIASDGLACPRHPARLMSAEALIENPATEPPAVQLGDPNRPGYIVYTSGSGGQPRAVVHAHRAVWARRMMIDGWYGLGPEDRMCHAGALNWTFTLGTGLLDPWAVGASALIPGKDVAPAQLPQLLKRHNATIFAAVPGIYRKMLKSGLPQMPGLRHGLSAGETLPPALRAAWQSATGTDIHEALGMSECSTFISGSPARPAPAGSTGFAQAGRRVAILAEDGTPAPTGTPGRLAVHKTDPGLMLGYWSQTEAPRLPLEAEWFVTGDQVQSATNGAITFKARLDDILNAGGFRVAPQEIEAAFAGLPGLGECAACEIALRADTRIIALAIEGEAGFAELKARAQTRLAAYKQPRVYVRLPELPRSANGKLARARLAELVKEHYDDPP
ncbi:MAG: class I adenylate-forming enzyme family protein [Pseudomonadota bacterium]